MRHSNRLGAQTEGTRLPSAGGLDSWSRKCYKRARRGERCVQVEIWKGLSHQQPKTWVPISAAGARAQPTSGGKAQPRQDAKEHLVKPARVSDREGRSHEAARRPQGSVPGRVPEHAEHFRSADLLKGKRDSPAVRELPEVRTWDSAAWRGLQERSWNSEGKPRPSWAREGQTATNLQRPRSPTLAPDGRC